MNNRVAQCLPMNRRGLFAAALSATALSASTLSVAVAHAGESRADNGKADNGAQPASWVSSLALQAATYAMPIVC